MSEESKNVLANFIASAALCCLIVAIIAVSSYFSATEAQQKQIVYNKIVDIINASGLEYNLSVPKYDGFQCERMAYHDEDSWKEMNSSIFEFLKYANQTGDSEIYILKVDTTPYSVNSGSVT